MKLRKILIVAGIVAGLVGLLYIVFTPPHYSWRQKLTLSVETPRGIVEGSAVTQADYYDARALTLGFPDVSGVSSSFTGESVAVEIAPGRILFVLLGHEWGRGGPSAWPGYIWHKQRDTFDESMTFIQAQLGKPAQSLPQTYWPPMVTFGDISRPETLRLVTGTDLSAWFGPGIRLESLLLQITDEPVTKGRIEQILPWLMPESRTRALVAFAPSPPLSFSAFLSLDHWSKK